MQDKTRKLMCYLVVALMLIVSAISVLGAVGNSGNSPYSAGTGVVRSDGGYPGNWSFSENASGYPTGTLDEAWWFDVNVNWGVENCSGYDYIGDQVQWALTCNISDSTTYEYVSYALLNDSGMNRSQSIYWFKTNDSANEVFPGFIYNAISNNDWDGLFFGANEVYHLHWNGSGLSNVTGAQENASLTTPAMWENHWTANWGQISIAVFFDEPQPWLDNGSYVKVIYNAENDSVQGKCWGDSGALSNGLWTEPAGWNIDTNLSASTSNNRSIGFAVLNPTKKNVTVNFDMLQVWNLNSSLNHSSTSYGANPASNRRPHMDFPIINAQAIITDFQAYFNGTGNITADGTVDIARRLTNRFNLESRPFVPASTSILDQNDTVYYYSSVVSNFTYVADMFNVTGEYIPNNVLVLNIQQCPDGATSACSWAFVAIDVDGNNTWDANDRAWMWYYDGTRYQWNGSVYDAGFYAADNVTHTIQTSTRNLHRYSRHTQYTLGVDLETLIKNDSTSLNAGDTFRLLILTGNGDDSKICSWNNWNETGNTPWTANESHNVVKEYFLNTSTLTDADLTINSTSVGRWGEGEIGDGSATVLSGYTGTYLDIEKDANVTYITNRYAGTHRINYTIRLRNLQDTPLTNIYVNDSILRETNSDFNWTFVYATGTWTINNASGYMFWSVGTIVAGGYQNYTYVVDAVRTNGSSNYQLMPNTVYANCSQGVDDTDTYNIRWGVAPLSGFPAQLDTIMGAIYALVYMIFVLALIGFLFAIMGKIFK